MITSLICGLVIGEDKLTVGQKWEYVLTWHFKNKEIDSTDEESFNVEVTKTSKDSTTIQVSQKLEATLFDGNRVPTDPKAAPAKNDWALFGNRAIAFMPNARFPLESRFYRILKNVMPEPKGDPSRDREWTIDFPDDGVSMPASALMARYNKRTKEGSIFFFSYRENGGVSATGQFIRNEKTLFPSLLEAHFTNTRMPGGTETVDCDFTMKLNPEKTDK